MNNYNIIKNSKYFNKSWYKNYYLKYNDKTDPVRHYLEEGWKIGNNPSMLFHNDAYLYNNLDVLEAEMNPLLHYELNGKNENRKIYHLKAPAVLDKMKGIFKKSPKISIIVASYNYEDYIKETLSSLLMQTYKNYEIIVVDDGSKDNSIQVIREFMGKSNKIKLYTHENNANKGLAETIKLGISNASGEFIAFCESDDKWHPEHLETKFNIIKNYPNAQIILNNIETTGNITKENIVYYMKYLRKYYNSNIKTISFGEIREVNYIPTFSAVMVKKTLLQHCDYHTPIIPWLDLWLWRQVMYKENTIHYTSRRLTEWRIHSSYNTADKAAEYGRQSGKFKEMGDIVILGKMASVDMLEERIQNEHKIIKNSKYFDEEWYRTQDIPEYVTDYALHYLECGYQEHLSPSKEFDNDKYLQEHQDVYMSNTNPLLYWEINCNKT